MHRQPEVGRCLLPSDGVGLRRHVLVQSAARVVAKGADTGSARAEVHAQSLKQSSVCTRERAQSTALASQEAMGVGEGLERSLGGRSVRKTAVLVDQDGRRLRGGRPFDARHTPVRRYPGLLGWRRPLEETKQLHGEGKHEGRVPFGSHLDHRLKQPQLQGGRMLRHHLGGLGELLWRPAALRWR